MKKQTYVLALALALAASPAWALPREGDARPEATLVDVDDHELRLSGTSGRPLLVVYEDKDSARMNQALKDDLAKLARGDRYKTSVALVAVADVQGYDYWPVRGFVKSAIRDEGKKIGIPIYCDWHGKFRRALDIPRGTSTVILAGRDGRVLFARSGALSAAERRELVDLLRSQVDSATASR